MSAGLSTFTSVLLVAFDFAVPLALRQEEEEEAEALPFVVRLLDEAARAEDRHQLRRATREEARCCFVVVDLVEERER